MGRIFPSIDGVLPEEEKTLCNEDTIEQSMSMSQLNAPIIVDASSLSLRQSQLDEGSSSNCQQITVNCTSYYKNLNRSTPNYRQSKHDSNLSSGSSNRSHYQQ